MLEAVSQLRSEFEASLSSQRQELEESKLRERALRAQIIEYGKAAEEARAQQRRQPQVVEMPNVEHIQQLATATASAVAAREVLKMDPRQLVQDLKDELVGSFTHKMTQLESQSGSSNDATIAAMRASMQRERESTVSEVKEMMQQLQQQLQQHYDDNISRLSAAAAAREAELIAEANLAKQLAAEAAAAAAAAEKTASAAAAATAAVRAVVPSVVVAAHVEQQQHQVISAQSLREVSSSSAPASPESISSFEEGAAAVVQLPPRALQDSMIPAAAAAPLHLSSASEADEISDDEPMDAVPEDTKAALSESARSLAEATQASRVLAAPEAEAAAAAPDSPSSSSSSSAHTSATASPDEIKPPRVGASLATPPPPTRSAQAKLGIDDLLPAHTLTMPQGYTGSPIMSRVFIAVEEIQEQLHQVETFLSRKHAKAAATTASSTSGAMSSNSAAASSISGIRTSDSAARNQSAIAAGGAARVPAAAAAAALAQDAMSEQQRRREQQQKQQPSSASVPAPAKLDTVSNQAMQMRALLLRGDGNDSDSDDGGQPVRSASFDTRQHQHASEPLLLAPVARSALRASGSGPKSGSGALLSGSDSDEHAGVILALQRKSGLPSSPVAKASLSVAASRRSAAAGAAETSSSGETDASSESDYEEDFDAESGGSSSRQQPVKVRRSLLPLPTSAVPIPIVFPFSRCKSCGKSPLLPLPLSSSPSPPSPRRKWAISWTERT